MNKGMLVKHGIYTGFALGLMFSAIIYNDTRMIFIHIGIAIIQATLLNLEYRK